MQEIIDFLKKNKFGSLATIDEETIDNRPMEMVCHGQRGFYFYAATTSEVIKQLRANENICFCATDAEYNYVKIKGTAKLSAEKEDRQMILQQSAFAKENYDEETLDNMMVIYVPGGTAMMHTHKDNQLITDRF
jgi:uncharacterized pyridoxamine 5'-phosphate oxidase family protein